MISLSNILLLIRKEFTLELRRSQTIAGIILFTITSIFLIYKTFLTLNAQTWNILIWFILIFSGINAVAKSFMANGNNRLFEYTQVSSHEMILAKLIYNFVFLLLIFLIIYCGFSFFLNNPIKEPLLFFKASLLGILGISGIYTFVSSVSSNTEGGGALLMSVLAIPLTIPTILLLIKITAVAMRLMQDTSVGEDLLLLFGIDMLIYGIILLVFAELWKE